jgi:FKBP12-rapamycin complex-associated protein
VIGGGGTTGEDYGTDLLPSAGLVTSSEDYYPTVAINALMRVLRDSALASQHQVRRFVTAYPLATVATPA